MGSPGVVEGTQTMKILLAGAFLAVALAAPEAAPEAAASPEANADPWYGYYGYGLHRPYGYGYYGYRPCGYGYYYGKRSAEAEPEAAPTADAAASPDADAWYGSYGYGLHRPYGYGYYGYRPYGYTYWGKK